MSEAVLEARGLCKAFGGKQALSDFSLAIAKGGVHAIVGSNGAGKSTLFRALLGFITPDRGESRVLGEDSRCLSPDMRGRIGYVNEEHTLPDWLQVRELKRMQRSYYPAWREDIYRQVIANFDVAPEQKVASLSRGERAGFNLAMALAQDPELLILDEPTLGLDVVAKQEFLESLLFCAEVDTTVIYCSHQMEEVERLADELIVMEQGRLKVQAAPEEFSRRVRLWIVDAAFRALIVEKVPGFLNGRLIEDKFHFFVFDADESLPSRLSLLGVRDVTSSPVGLAGAVRAFLAKNHLRAEG